MSADSLGLLLKAFCLPTMAESYERVVQEAEQQGWVTASSSNTSARPRRKTERSANWNGS